MLRSLLQNLLLQSISEMLSERLQTHQTEHLIKRLPGFTRSCIALNIAVSTEGTDEANASKKSHLIRIAL